MRPIETQEVDENVEKVQSAKAEEFVEWLRLQGYNASVGRDTHHHIGGYDTSVDDEANEKMRNLWNRYCDEA